VSSSERGGQRATTLRSLPILDCGASDALNSLERASIEFAKANSASRTLQNVCRTSGTALLVTLVCSFEPW